MSLKDIPPTFAEISGQVPKLTLSGPGGKFVHVKPTVQGAAARAAVNPSGGPLTYHAGGSVMTPYVAIYVIFWAPAKLQNGATTGFSSLYGTEQVLLGAWYPGHGLLNLATQYYQVINGTTTYVSNNGGLGGYYVDTSPYPASGCSDSLTPGNCITDAQIEAEIQKVMGLNAWTGGMNKIYALYTSSGEGSCFDNTNASCAYVNYCAYHSSFFLNGQNVIYANEPYGNPNTCQGSQTTPNDLYADIAANSASHEFTEAATDPLGNAWFDSSGNEIGDICAYQFGSNTWDNGLANQMWNGWFFDLQMEYSNHSSGCLQVGP